MPRRRNRQSQAVTPSREQEREEVTQMSVFETMTQDEWVEVGAGASAAKGEYAQILSQFSESGAEFARISTETGRFAGKKASSVSTALKNARDSKSAPEGVGSIKITSKGGVVYLQNGAE